MPDLISSAKPRARKPHRCGNCNGLIAAGETYNRDIWKYDGRVYAWLTCAACRLLVGAVFDWAGCPDEGIGMSEFEDWAREHLDHPEHANAARDLLARITSGAGGS